MAEEIKICCVCGKELSQEEAYQWYDEVNDKDFDICLPHRKRKDEFATIEKALRKQKED